MDLARGNGHSIEVVFEGTQEHLSAASNGTVTVWADILITIDATSTETSVRSDIANPIRLTGSISEVGGIGEVFEDVVIYIGNNSNCINGFESAFCFSGVTEEWSIGNFTLTATTPTSLQPGPQYISVDVPRDTALYINGASRAHPLYVKVNAEITPSIDTIVENEDEKVNGDVSVIAIDTSEGLSGIAVVFSLNSGNGTRLATMTSLTDSDGVATFEFNNDPPFGDDDIFGKLSLDIVITDPRLSQQTLDNFDSLRSQGFAPEYEYEEEAAGISVWTYVVLLFLAAIVAAGTVMYQRRKETELMSEMAEVFEYTAELLAAGDSIREAIFNCYQNLCASLQSRGLLRRDFETVREFEVAIRQATPGISDESLQALDNMFEMARYGREELGAQHQQSAQAALDRMISELSYKNA
jgi:hypothetical protein